MGRPDDRDASAFEPGQAPGIEWVGTPGRRPEISHVLFDFDGTISLVRQGWPEVMVPMFLEAVLPRLAGRIRARTCERLALDDIMRLNGKQTIYQMIQLAARIRGARGPNPGNRSAYKHEYLRRLDLGTSPRRTDRARPGCDDPRRKTLLVHRRPPAPGASPGARACGSDAGQRDR